MAFELTQNTKRAVSQQTLKPQLVFEIDGVPTRFGSAQIYKYIRIGDPDLLIGSLDGQPWYIGGFSLIENQSDYISFGRSGAGKISQTLNPSKGQGTTVSRMVVALIDKNEEISRLISPGFDVPEILGRNCRIYLGFQNTAFPQDYITILRGQIESIESASGVINFVVSSPEEKKRQKIFARAKGKLAAPIAGTGPLADITLESSFQAGLFPNRSLGPDGVTYDPALKLFVKIDEEILLYESQSGSQLLNLTRGMFGTTAATHSTGANVESIISLEGNGIELALKLMLSGFQGPYKTGVEIGSFNYVEGAVHVQNAIYFPGLDLSSDEGLRSGDWIYTSGATNGANNDSFQIVDIFQQNNGSYAVVDAVLMDESTTSAIASFRSQYDTLSQGCKMQPNEVDVAQHLNLFELFLSAYDLRIEVPEVGSARDFIDEEIYKPMAAFSVPRKGQVSVGIHQPPIPGTLLKTLSQDNVLNASKLVLRRNVTDFFFNEVNFNFDYDVVTGDYLSKLPEPDNTSKADIKVGNKVFEINSAGLRTDLQANVLAVLAADRLLTRYGRGAEHIRGVEVQGRDGFEMEIGDVHLIDFESLKLTDTTQGRRGGKLRLMEVQNKIFDSVTGKVSIDLVNTSFNVDDRFGLISPASFIKSVISNQKFIIEKSFRKLIPEGQKWQDLVTAAIIVRNTDWTTVYQGVIASVSGDTITLEAPLSGTPTPGMLMMLDEYNNQPDLIKLQFAFITDADNDFADGGAPYLIL